MHFHIFGQFYLNFTRISFHQVDTLQDEFIREVKFRENFHFMHIRGLIYLWLKTVTLYEELTLLCLAIELTLCMRTLRVSFSI